MYFETLKTYLKTTKNNRDLFAAYRKPFSPWGLLRHSITIYTLLLYRFRFQLLIQIAITSRSVLITEFQISLQA